MGAGHAHSAGESLTRWAWLSLATALVTMAMLYIAYLITGSIGLLSDALETLVNVVAAVIALIALRTAARPADERHPFGHGKVEYLSAGAEGAMIVGAAVVIIITSVERLLHPEPLDSLGIGLALSAAATVLNLLVGILIIRAGRRARSIALEADGRHVLTDVLTSAGVLLGVGLVAVTHWAPLDSLVGLAVAVNIIVVGGGIIWRSIGGLLDRSLPPEDLAIVERVVGTLRAHYPPGTVDVHGIQTRESGRDRFVRMHVLVPGDWTVQRGHDLLEELEGALETALPGVVIDTHLEPLEDPRAYEHSGHEHSGHEHPAHEHPGD